MHRSVYSVRCRPIGYSVHALQSWLILDLWIFNFSEKRCTHKLHTKLGITGYLKMLNPKTPLTRPNHFSVSNSFSSVFLVFIIKESRRDLEWVHWHTISTSLTKTN